MENDVIEYQIRKEPKAEWACFSKGYKYYEVNIIDLENDEIQDALNEAIVSHTIDLSEGE
jgi:hypothetical protein